MHRCPACNESLSGNETACPKCGVTLHPYSLNADSGGSEGTSTYVIIVVGVGLVAVMLVCLGCLGIRNWFVGSFLRI